MCVNSDLAAGVASTQCLRKKAKFGILYLRDARTNFDDLWQIDTSTVSKTICLDNFQRDPIFLTSLIFLTAGTFFTTILLLCFNIPFLYSFVLNIIFVIV